MKNNTDIMSIDPRDLDRRNPDRATLRGIANALLHNADEIEVLFPIEANGMRNMAKLLDPSRVVSAENN